MLGRGMSRLSLVSKHSPVALKVHATSSLGSASFRVMCATDLWARSNGALEKALWLAEVTDAQLLLLHVVDGELPLRIAGRKADLARGALEWRLRGASSFTLRPAVSVRIGNPQQTILRVARDWRADLVVLGATSARIRDRFFGTTAERIASEARCAALVVNRADAMAYSSVGVIAASCCQAAALESDVDRLQVMKGGASVRKVYPLGPRSSRWKSPGRHAVAELLRAPPEVVVSEVDRWPGMSELLRRGVSGMVARTELADVLITPRHTRTVEAAVRCWHHLRVLK
jgi:nucleotide-binding universal stress UspA family protein